MYHEASRSLLIYAIRHLYATDVGLHITPGWLGALSTFLTPKGFLIEFMATYPIDHPVVPFSNHWKKTCVNVYPPSSIIDLDHNS